MNEKNFFLNNHFGPVFEPTLGSIFFFSPDSDSATLHYWEMMLLKFLLNKIWPSPLLVQLGQFVGHTLGPKFFWYRYKNLDYISTLCTNFQLWGRIFSCLNKSLLPDTKKLPMPALKAIFHQIQFRSPTSESPFF